VCGVASDLWEATRERPSLPEAILHIELGVPPLGTVSTYRVVA